MVFAYPAIFKQNHDASYEGRFPDLPGLSVNGPTLDHAINNAIDLLRGVIYAELTEEEDPSLHKVSHIDDLPLEEGEEARLISCSIHLDMGWSD